MINTDVWSNQKIKYYLLFGLILFHLINNIICVYLGEGNIQLIGKDCWQNHIRYYSILLKNIEQAKIIEMDINGIFSKIQKIILIAPDYPPLYYLTAYLLRLILLKQFPQIVFLTSTLFLIVMIITVFKIAEKIRPGTGGLSAFISSFFPYVVNNSRFFNLELAVCAMVSVCFYFFINSGIFTQRKQVVLLGIFSGLGMLIKFTFAIFFVWLIFMMVFELIYNKKHEADKQNKRKNVMMCLLICICLAGSYYFNKKVMEVFLVRAMNIDSGIFMPVLERSVFYAAFLVKKMIEPLKWWMTLCFIIIFLKTKIEYKREFIFMCVSPLIIAGIVPKYPPEPEYILPLLPFIGIMTGIGICEIKNKGIKSFIILLIMLIMTDNYFKQNDAQHYICFDKPVKEVSAVFKHIGGENKICYMADNDAKIYFPGIEQFLSVWSKNLASVDYFSDNKEKCFSKIEDYNFVIIADLSVQKGQEYNFPGNVYKLKFYPFTMSPELQVSVYIMGREYIKRFKNEFQSYITRKRIIGQNKFKSVVWYHATIMLANNYCSIGRYELAERYYLKAIALNPKLSYGYLEVANCYLQAAKRKEVVKHQKIKIINFREKDFYPEKQKLELYEKAFNNLEKAMELGSKYKLMYRWLFDLARQFKIYTCYDNALKILFILRQKNMFLREIYTELDDLFIRWQMPENTICFYLYLKELFPDDYRIDLRLGRIYKMVQDYELSKKYFCNVLKQVPDFTEAQQGILNADNFIAISKNRSYPIKEITEPGRLDYNRRLGFRES